MNSPRDEKIMPAYYNETDPFCAQWLRNLIAAGLIAPGDVDERDIRDVKPDELVGYTQCHFFVGVGGWSIALRLAGWPDDKPVWTGSCPCQPFSQAGKGRGFADERHLWPAWFNLIKERCPGIVFGEQVAGKDGLGWLDLVQTDLETADYACGAVDLCAAGVGAPHIRQRLWFVGMADGYKTRWSDDKRGSGQARETRRGESYSSMQRMGNTDRDGCKAGSKAAPSVGQGRSVTPTGWNACDWVKTSDGKCRPTEPGVYPLAYGVLGESSAIGPYGNAIVPQVAAEFISAFVDIADV